MARHYAPLSALFLLACSAPRRPVPPPALAPRPTPIAAAPAPPPAALTPTLLARARTLFRPAAALALTRVADQGFRARGNEPFVRLLDAVTGHLRAGGAEAPSPAARFTVTQAFSSRDVPVWTPRRAALSVTAPVREPLLSFDAAHDQSRTMLVAGTRGGTVEGPLVVWPARGPLPRGAIVLTTELRAPALAAQLGAGPNAPAAILSSYLFSFNNPAAHPDAIHYDLLRTSAPSALLADISPTVAARLRELASHGAVRVRLEAEVDLHQGDTPMVVAELRGTEPSAGPVIVVAHADEPGANDNGSGVATVAELAVTLATLVRQGALPPPRRSVLFLVGMEMEASGAWLDTHPEVRPAMGLSLDMAGQPPEVAPMLIERAPDPGNELVLPGDEHTAWFDGESGTPPTQRSFFVNALAVNVMQQVDPGWAVREHPFEGGSDHEVFLQHGYPAVLFWHFPDDAYHTSRDRMERVSADEMLRVGVGSLAMAYLAAAGTDEAAVEVVNMVVAYAQQRFQRVVAASQNADASRYRAHLTHWASSLTEAAASAEALVVGPAPRAHAAVEAARARVAELAAAAGQRIGR